MAITLDGSNGILSPDFEPSSSTLPTNGLFLPTTNALGFATNSTERLRLDANGNLGIGTSSPGSKLEVNGNQIINYSGQSQSLLTVGGGSTSAAMNLRGSAGSAYAWQISTNSFVASALEFTRSTAVGGTTFSTPSMLLDSSGNLLVGTTSSSGAKLDVSGRARITQGLAYQETVSVANGSTYDFLMPIDNGVFAITIANSSQTTALFTAKLTGGSTGCYQLAQAGGVTNFAFGTTAEPAGGTYGRVWYSGTSNTIRLKNVGGSTFTFAISVITYGS